MDHERVRELFSEYMDGELDAATEDEVREHLGSCEQCSEEYADFRRTFETFRSLPEIPAPPDLEQKIKRRIRVRSRGKFFSATTEPFVIYRVPYEFISLILILIAMFCLYIMTTVGSVEHRPAPLPEDDPQSQPRDAPMPEPRTGESGNYH